MNLIFWFHVKKQTKYKRRRNVFFVEKYDDRKLKYEHE